MTFDLIVKNARVLDRDEPIYIGIVDGVFLGIGDDLGGADTYRTVDADGALVLPGLVEPHVHFDKACIIDECEDNESGLLADAIRINTVEKARFDEANVLRRAERALQQYLVHGASYIRAHVDVDRLTGQTCLRALCQLRRKYAGLVDIQISAFPHFATSRDPQAVSRIREAMENGADVVGAFPDVEPDYLAGCEHIDRMLELAAEVGADLDVHIDEGDSLVYLDHLASEALRTSFCGQIVASHACALGSCPPAERDRVMHLLAEAGIAVVVCPFTNLIMAGRFDSAAPRRGLAPLKLLHAAGIGVSYGQDNMQDMFCPFGVGDVLQTGLIASLAGHMTTSAEVRELLEMCTTGAARMLRLPRYGLQDGMQADFVVLGASSPLEAIRGPVGRRYIGKHGKLVSGTALARTEWDARLASC